MSMEPPSGVPPTAPDDSVAQDIDEGGQDAGDIETGGDTRQEVDDGADVPAAVVSPNYEGVDSGASEATEAYAMSAQGCLVGLLVTSCVTLAQAAQNCKNRDKFKQDCDGEYGFAVAAGCIPMILCIVFLYLQRAMTVTFNRFVPYFALFMVLWAGVVVAITTFGNSFTVTGNGYFAVWGMLFISVYFAQISVAKFKAVLGKAMSSALAGNQQKRVLMIIMLFSVVFALASLVEMNEKPETNQEVFGFCVGLISGGVISIYQLFKIFKAKCPALNQNHLRYLSYFLGVFWLFGAGVVTFDQPFTLTGNGYFSAWGAFLSSCYLAYLTSTQAETNVPTSP